MDMNDYAINENQKLLSKAEKVKMLVEKIASVEYDLKQAPQEGDIILTWGLGVSGFNCWRCRTWNI